MEELRPAKCCCPRAGWAWVAELTVYDELFPGVGHPPWTWPPYEYWIPPGAWDPWELPVWTLERLGLRPSLAPGEGVRTLGEDEWRRSGKGPGRGGYDDGYGYPAESIPRGLW